MKQFQTLLKENADGVEERWYSDEYLRDQIERAYQAGISSGIQVKFHVVEPTNLESVIDYKTLFWNTVNKEYEKHFNQGHVWKVASKHTFNN